MRFPDPGQIGARREQASISDSSRRGRRATVVVYSRPGCHLCERAVAELAELHERGYCFELHEVDIESEELLLRSMLERIPVVEVNGVLASELVLDRAAVIARLDTVGADDDPAGGR